MRQKAAANCRLFANNSWTPREIDKVLWTYGRNPGPAPFPVPRIPEAPMSNDWISRLVVTGPTEELRAFAKTATDPRILRRQGRTPWEGERRLGLSFTALARVLPPSGRARLKGHPMGTLGPGVAQHTYKFQAGWEPDRLLVELSSAFPRSASSWARSTRPPTLSLIAASAAVAPSHTGTTSSSNARTRATFSGFTRQSRAPIP
jgi:hypothetical protein